MTEIEEWLGQVDPRNRERVEHSAALVHAARYSRQVPHDTAMANQPELTQLTPCCRNGEHPGPPNR